MSPWKIVGLAGIVGVTVVGVAAGTQTVRRQRRDFHEADPDELRDRLRGRLAELDAAGA